MNSVLELKKRLKKEKLDALFVSNPANVSYLSGFTGDESYCLITNKKNFFITDFRYQQQAKEEISDFKIEMIGKVGGFDLISSLIEKNNLKKVGFDAKHITYGHVSQIRDRLKKSEFVLTYDLVEDIRIVKTDSEIELIRKAIGITKSVFNDISYEISHGKKTEKELAALFEYKAKLKSADGIAFDTIVLSGERSAMPHGRPSKKCIKNNELVLVDAGVKVNGYNSDLTRVFFLGKIPSTLKKIESVVKTAQEMAIKAVRPGVKASYIDAVARNYITKHGWGKNFGHSLGHGVGREVHELPSLSPKSKSILRPGMVFTVEPAIYVNGLGGVRIEDMVLVTNKGSEVLTKCSTPHCTTQ